MRRIEREPVDPAVRDRYERMWPQDGPDGEGPDRDRLDRAGLDRDGPDLDGPDRDGPDLDGPDGPGNTVGAARDERIWSDLATFGDPWDLDARSGPSSPSTSRAVSLPPPDASGWPGVAGDAGRRGAARDAEWPEIGGDGGSRVGSGGPATAMGAQVLAALSPGRRGVKALAVIGVAIALVAGFLAWQARPHTTAVPTVSSQPQPPPGGPATGPGAPAVSPTPSAALLVVAVEGRVRHPGLVHLPPGSRVADALSAAGGALPGTDLSFVNLARKVVDGELIVIGMTPPPGVETGGADPSGGAAAGGIVDLNTATAADLDTLPGIGPALAQRILDYRTQHGGFHSVDELRNVSGIGDAKFAEIKDLVTV
ncbi:MAG TPA: ComEA family DNA-binding protein [Micromonosporaceae bacterium]|nr:ComEA family DNA-binding protein [Micromonosporaceae bacterium]